MVATGGSLLVIGMFKLWELWSIQSSIAKPRKQCPSRAISSPICLMMAPRTLSSWLAGQVLTSDLADYIYSQGLVVSEI